MYDPVLARFVSADSVVPGADALTLGPSKSSNGPDDPQQLNRYSYVTNNPVKKTDPTGHFAWIIAGAVIGMAINVTAYAVTQKLTGNEMTWGGVGEAALSGAIGGAVTAAAGPLAGSLVSSEVGVAIAGRVGTTVLQTAAEGVLNIIGNEVGSFAGAAAKEKIDGAPSSGDYQKTAVTSVMDTGVVSKLSVQAGMDSMGDVNRLMQPVVQRGSQTVTRAFAEHSFAMSAAKVNWTMSAIGGIAIGALYDVVKYHMQNSD